MAAPKTTRSRPPRIPPLEPGDHLTRDEFERRYEAMPHVKKAELIEGVVYMPSPVRLEHHGSPQADVIAWLCVYKAYTPGVKCAVNATVRLDLGNEPQPDAVLIIEPACGGQARVSPDDYIEGAPELVAEVAASTASFDLHTKFEVYRRNQVREYIVWRVLDDAVDWFVWRENKYEGLAPSPAGYYQSEIFPGLWLDPAALVRSELLTVLQVLQQGLASPEHAAFAARLQAASPRP